MHIQIGDEKIEIQERTSSRAKRLKLKYRKDRIELVKPESTNADVRDFLNEKKDWLINKAREVKKYRENKPERDIRDGGSINVLGEQKQIRVESRKSGKVNRDIVLAEHLVERNGLKEQLEKRLREHAREKITEYIEEYISEIDGSYNKVFIRDQETRWGSCSPKNNLNFNWRLVLGPEYILRYVVVHELVHLEIDNHGEEYHRKVKELFDRKEEAEKWLKENGARLEFT